jgi:hypothetical protein
LPAALPNVGAKCGALAIFATQYLKLSKAYGAGLFRGKIKHFDRTARAETDDRCLKVTEHRQKAKYHMRAFDSRPECASTCGKLSQFSIAENAAAEAMMARRLCARYAETEAAQAPAGLVPICPKGFADGPWPAMP